MLTSYDGFSLIEITTVSASTAAFRFSTTTTKRRHLRAVLSSYAVHQSHKAVFIRTSIHMQQKKPNRMFQNEAE